MSAGADAFIADRVARLVAQFDGAIKYAPMVNDHPDWPDDQCLARAREGHAIVMARLRPLMTPETGWPDVDPQVARDYLGRNPALWNHGISYCRNIPTLAMVEEAYGRT